ncbi:MAG: hypothetical protein ACLPKB_11505 [Xanthobacteraceae bacterium]
MRAKRFSGASLAIVASFFLVTGATAHASEQGWKTHRVPHHAVGNAFARAPGRDVARNRSTVGAGWAEGAYQGPGYVFVPGKGILGEACNLPTSTCENQYRDVQ